MATVQILAFITLDGYLARRSTFPDLWEYPGKYGITRIRERAFSRLDPTVSFIALAGWKRERSGVYLAEANLETFPLADSLLRFNMADELVLYVLPCFQGEGFRLFEGGPGVSAWELAGTHNFRRNVCRLRYRRVAGG